MGRIKYLLLIIAISLSLTACTKKEEALILTVTYDSNVKQILYDGEYLYTLAKESSIISEKRLPITESTEQAKYLMGSLYDYTLSYVFPGKYQGDYASGCGYINYLISQGYTEEKHEATSEYYDITLKSSEGRIRVIILNNDQIKIFYENLEKSAGSPPYINGKRGNN